MGIKKINRKKFWEVQEGIIGKFLSILGTSPLVLSHLYYALPVCSEVPPLHNSYHYICYVSKTVKQSSSSDYEIASSTL